MASEKKARLSSYNAECEVEDNDFYNAEEDFDDWGNFGLTQVCARGRIEIACRILFSRVK